MTEAMQLEFFVRFLAGAMVGVGGFLGFITSLFKFSKEGVIGCLLLMIAALFIVPPPMAGFALFCVGMVVAGCSAGDYRQPIDKSWLFTGLTILGIGLFLMFYFVPPAHPAARCLC